MDVLSRIKSTVSNFGTVVLPGNPVTREYEIVEHIASAGPTLLWKVYKGIKKSTKEEGAVFVLEKKLLDKYSKQDRETILAVLKKGVSNLTRLRHPSILTVQHSLEESRESLAFATEPIFASLANILGFQENLPIPPPKALKDFELFDIEIKYGFLQVTEGLAFLHNDVKMTHGNINLESILVNKNGAWKIAGFDFCLQFSTGSEQQVDPNYESDLPPPCRPHPDFASPERILGGICNPAGDMYSLGTVLFSVHSKGKSLLRNAGCSTPTIKKNYEQLKSISPSAFSNLPSECQDHVKMLLTYTAELRPDAFQTSKLPMFEDIGVKTLQYLDSLYQWDNLQKSQFYKGLPQVIAQMPKRVNLHRVVPCLAREYPTPEMVPFILPSVLYIAEDATKDEFQTLILPDMVSLFRLREPVQVTLIFLQRMELLLSKCPQSVISNHVLPMIYTSLESDAQQIQELCLGVIPKFANLVEFSAMKNALLPRVKKLCINTSYLSVRVNCLVCLGKLLEHLDKWLVLDEILPFLSQIPSKEPAVLMGVLGILKLTMSHKKLGITKEIMATKVIPFLMPLSIENGLTINQFHAIMGVVKEMVASVETEHRAKLEQLNSIRQEHNSTLDMTKVPEFAIEGTKNNASDLFKDLGLSNIGSMNKSSSTSILSQSTNTPQKPNDLSIEDKKSLAWAQEQQLQWGKTSSLVPTPAPALGNDLIMSNLKGLTATKDPHLNSNQMQSMAKTNWSPTGGQSQPMVQSGWSPSGSQPQSLVGNSWNSIGAQQQLAPTWSSTMGQSPNSHNWASGNGQPQSLNMNNWSNTGMQPILGGYASPQASSIGGALPPQPSFVSPSSMDLRSLDSLLPNIGNRPTPTLSQLSGIPKISSPPRYIPPQPKSPSTSITNAARNELDDLLG